MRDRLLTFALAVGAFAAFYMLLAPKPSPPQEKPTRPITTERGPNGYLGMMSWLTAEGVEPLSLRQRYGHLPELTAAAPTGNLLISTAPHIYPLRDSETGPLRDWISAGNTLLVVAGLSDTPDWSMGEGADPGFMRHLRAMTGLEFVVAQPEAATPNATGAHDQPGDAGFEQKDSEAADRNSDESATDARSTSEQDTDDGQSPDAQNRAASDEKPEVGPRQSRASFQKLAQPLHFELVPNGAHPLLEGVKTVAAISEYPSSQWRASSSTGDLVLELAQDPASGEPMLWLLRHGKGQIVVGAYGSVFTNKLLGEKDNARLLANIVKWSRGKGGQVIIDDAHQGLVAFYDPQAFFGDCRLHRTLWWLLGLWLIFVLGPQRLRATGSSWNPVDVTSFVRASGGFMARVLKPAAAGQQLFVNFFNAVRRQAGLPLDGEPIWDWMRGRGAVSAGDVEQLRELHEKVLHGRRVDLPKLHNLLTRVRAGLT